MEGILGVMQRVAEQESRRIHTTELGLITAVFPHSQEKDTGNYQCSVRLKNRKLPGGGDFELREVPVSTPYIGLACIPRVGDLVLVSFLGGDIQAPVITGRLYSDEVRPPLNQPQELLLQHTPATGGSLKLDAEGRIVLTSKNGKNVLTLDDEKISVVTEKLSLVVDVTTDRIVISSEKDVEIVAKSGKLRLDGKEVEINSQGTLKLSAGADVELKTSAAMVLKGQTIDLN